MAQQRSDGSVPMASETQGPPEQLTSSPTWLRPSPLSDRPAAAPCTIFTSYSPSKVRNDYGDEAMSTSQRGRGAQASSSQMVAVAAAGMSVAQTLQRATESAARAESQARRTLEQVEALKASNETTSHAAAPARPWGPNKLAAQPALKFISPRPKMKSAARAAKKPAASVNLLPVSDDAGASATTAPSPVNCPPAAELGDVGAKHCAPLHQQPEASTSVNGLPKSFAGSGAPKAGGALHAAWLATVGVWNTRLGSQKLPGGTLEAQRQMWSYVKSEMEEGQKRGALPWHKNDRFHGEELKARVAQVSIYARDKAEEWMVTFATRLQAAGIKICTEKKAKKQAKEKGKETSKGKGQKGQGKKHKGKGHGGEGHGKGHMDIAAPPPKKMQRKPAATQAK